MFLSDSTVISIWVLKVKSELILTPQVSQTGLLLNGTPTRTHVEDILSLFPVMPEPEELKLASIKNHANFICSCVDLVKVFLEHYTVLFLLNTSLKSGIISK